MQSELSRIFPASISNRIATTRMSELCYKAHHRRLIASDDVEHGPFHLMHLARAAPVIRVARSTQV